MTDDHAAARAAGCYECRGAFTESDEPEFRRRSADELIAFHPACWASFAEQRRVARGAAEKHVRATGCDECRKPFAEGEPVVMDGRQGRHRACHEKHMAREAARAERERLQRIELQLKRLKVSVESSKNGPMRYDACGCGTSRIPFPSCGARFDDPIWVARCHPKIVNAWQVYDPTGTAHNMLILSETGGGKTSGFEAWVGAAEARLEAEIRAGAGERHMAFTYITGQDISGCRRRSKIGEEAPLLEHAMRVRLLFLDELGFEPLAPDGEVFALIDSRYRANLPTVVASGLTLEKFDERYGGAFRRRLLERGLLVNAFRKAGREVRSVG